MFREERKSTTFEWKQLGNIESLYRAKEGGRNRVETEPSGNPLLK